MVKKTVKPKTKKPPVKRLPVKRAPTGQTQTQHVTVNITKPSTISRKTTPTIKEQPKQFLPMMPSFNVNQPTPQTDLAKLVGLLNKKIETESTLGVAVSKKAEAAKEPVKSIKPPKKIAELKDPTESITLGDAVDIATPEPKVVATEVPPPVEAQPFLPEEEETPSPQLKPKKGKGKKSSVAEGIPILENYYPLMYELPFSGMSSKKNPLDTRYEKAFGEPYEGPNLKEKDYQKMIIQREKYNKELKRRQREEEEFGISGFA